MAGALAFAAEVADQRPLPLVRNLKATHPNADGYFAVRAQHRQGDGARTSRRRCKCVDCVEAAVEVDEVRRRHARRARGLPGADADAREQGAAPCLLRRARGQQDPRRARGHAAAQDQEGGRHRRRHHGRRHRDELPQRRHPGDDPGDEAGRAGPRRRRDPQELRGAGQEGQAQAGQVRAAHGAAEDHAGLRRHQGRRPGDRGGVRGHGRQGEGVQDARRGDEARRHPGHQHLHARRRQDRRLHQAPAGRDRHCTSSARPT